MWEIATFNGVFLPKLLLKLFLELLSGTNSRLGAHCALEVCFAWIIILKSFPLSLLEIMWLVCFLSLTKCAISRTRKAIEIVQNCGHLFSGDSWLFNTRGDSGLNIKLKQQHTKIPFLLKKISGLVMKIDFNPSLHWFSFLKYSFWIE